jgi:hypothetical protein
MDDQQLVKKKKETKKQRLERNQDLYLRLNASYKTMQMAPVNLATSILLLLIAICCYFTFFKLLLILMPMLMLTLAINIVNKLH